MSYTSDTEKKTMLTDLVELAKSDGVVSIPELTYLIWVANKLGVSKSGLMAFVNEKRPSYRKVSLNQRTEQFHRMLNMVFIDGDVADEELGSCKAIAYQIGLEPSKVDVFMKEVKANRSSIPDLEKLKACFRN